MNSRLPLARLVAIVVLAAVVAACGSGGASATPTPPRSVAPNSTGPASGSPSASGIQAIYDKIESQVQAMRELQPKASVSPQLLDQKGLDDWFAKANAEQTDHAAMAIQSRLLIHLGLLPAGSSLEQLQLDLASSQVIGFYDTVTKKLYVLSESGGVGVLEKVTFSHEYTHALQDQNFGLDKLATGTLDQGDRDLARTAVPEGDATLLMSQWSGKYLSILDLAQLAQISLSDQSTAQLAAAPAILRQDLTFPYDQGLSFVNGIYTRGGWAAVDALYANPPASTSQILHPELYASHVLPIPQTVPAVPAALAGWKLTMQDTLGEFQLGVWLAGEKPTSAQTRAATTAVAQWGGDRVGLYEGPNGAWAVVLNTVWRSSAGASDFSTATATRLGSLGASRTCGDATHVQIAIASDQSVIPSLLPCAG